MTFQRRLTHVLVQPVVWFVAGVLLEAHLRGEPLRWRMFLVALLALAFIAGVLHEGLRRGGTLDLLDELAAGDE